MALPHFRLPLNLPHAGTVADRIFTVLTQSARRASEAHAPAFEIAETLRDLLAPYRFHEDHPPADTAAEIQSQAAKLGRELVQEIARHKLGHDRLGQCVRNLFECLALGEEGAALSLTAGEHPHAVQRPRAIKPPPSAPKAPEELLPPSVRPHHNPVPDITSSLEPPGPIGEPMEGELGPPLEDSDDLDVPPTAHRKAKRPTRHKLLPEEEDPGDWTFED